MNYRFQKITTVYPEFAAQFLAGESNHRKLTYLELHQRFVAQYYGWSDYYGRRLQTLGNDSQEIFASLEPLQKQWAREHDRQYSQRGWLKEIVLAQVKAFRPDVVFLQDLYVFDEPFRRLLRDALGGRVIIIGFRAAPTEDYSIFKDLDLSLSCIPQFVETMREHGARAKLLMHAFEPEILKALEPTPLRKLDFTFIGSLIRRQGVHEKRFELVEKLLATTPLEVWGKISGAEAAAKGSGAMAKAGYYATRAMETVSLPQSMRAPVRLLFQGPEPPIHSLESSYPGRFHPPVFGLENFAVLSKSKLTFNNHIDCVGNDAGNMRLFEGTGTGACLVTDWKNNLPELFEPDVEVVAYKSVDECVEKVTYLLDHPSEYEAIGAAGQSRTLRDHTFDQRVEWLDAQIQKLLA